jgi:23S rRNA (adenine-N6)-dimethyltransferase
MPPPTVMSALLQIKQKPMPALEYGLKYRYLRFLFSLLVRPEQPARTALKKLFRKKQVRDLIGNLDLDPDGKITRLTPAQLACCFRELLDKVPEKYHPG